MLWAREAEQDKENRVSGGGGYSVKCVVKGGSHWGLLNKTLKEPCKLSGVRRFQSTKAVMWEHDMPGVLVLYVKVQQGGQGSWGRGNKSEETGR